MNKSRRYWAEKDTERLTYDNQEGIGSHQYEMTNAEKEVMDSALRASVKVVDDKQEG